MNENERVPSVFMLFHAKHVAAVRAAAPEMSSVDVARTIGRMWKALTEEERMSWVTHREQLKVECKLSNMSIVDQNSKVA